MAQWLAVRTDTIEYSLDGDRPRPARRQVDSFERFDTSGRLVEEKYFTDDGSILWQYRHSYDLHGRRVESKGTHSRFTYLSDRIVYEYDSAGNLILGREAIRAFYAGLIAMGRKFDFGDQRPAIVSGELALTSTRLPDGSVTAEVARRQEDGSWLWVIDQFSMG